MEKGRFVWFSFSALNGILECEFLTAANIETARFFSSLAIWRGSKSIISTSVHVWQLICRLGFDEWQSQPRLNFISEHKDRRKTKHSARCVKVSADLLAYWKWKVSCKYILIRIELEICTRPTAIVRLS